MSSFESIENMTIERFYTKFQGSEGDPKYRIANIGQHSIDFKKMIMFLTKDPENDSQHRRVYRGNSNIRPRPIDDDMPLNSNIRQNIPLRFSNNIANDSIRSGANVSFSVDLNFLGETWGQKN